MSKVPITYKESLRVSPKDRTLDLSQIGKKPRPRGFHWRVFWEDLRDFWQESYGAVRLYLTPEEASRERVLFASSLLVVFLTAAGFLGISNAVRLVHVSHAEQEQLQTLPDAFRDILANNRLTELPQLFTGVEDFLDELDKRIAPGLSGFYPDGSVLHDVSLVRQSLRDLTEAGRETTPLITAATTFMLDARRMENKDLRLKYGSLTGYLRLQWRQVKEKVYPHLATARDRLAEVNLDHLPGAVRSQVQRLRDTINDVTTLVERLDTHMPAILSILGEDAPRTYAILLQNSGEMRATGGFIGSFALVKLNDGWVEYLRFRDVYDIDGQLFEDVPPPPGIESISRFFSLRDSNYWPDFPTSAKQVAWFLDKDKGPGVDGVFAISDEVISRFLQVTGPVTFEGSKVAVDANNFMPLMSYLVESKQDKSQPKSAIFRFADAFMPRLTQSFLSNPASLQALSGIMEDRLLLAYSFDPDEQAFFEDAGLAGTLYQPGIQTASGQVMDYFMPVYTATGGNKSDRYIEQQITHDTRVTDEGVLQDQVTLVRHHTWNAVTEASIRDLIRRAVGDDISDRVLQILGGERNRQYMRFFVPRGSTLVSVEGVSRDKMKVTEDLGLTVIGFEMIVQPGEESRVKITYNLPDAVAANKNLEYFVVMQKQPGGDTLPVTKTFTPTKRAVMMADNTGYSVVKDSTANLALDIRPQEISLHNIWHGGYLLRVQ